MQYRSDINGLRAIAVLFVLFFHGGLKLFPSGFVGVDIFFVISGFLITSIISASIEKGDFSVQDFYTRRLWRLQPAFITTVFFTLLIATLFYPAGDFVEYLKEAKYASLFIANQYFSRSTTAYAAPDTNFLLLLHTWTLAIEWQWYLIMPAAIILLKKYFNPCKQKLIIGFFTLGAIALALFLSDKYPSKNYYFFTSRIFEFMLGVSLVFINPDNIRLSSKVKSTLAIISLFVIFYCATRQDILFGYPDVHAVAVAAATAVLIGTGTSGSNTVTRLLSTPFLVFIGSISYSLYLWHWPIFAAGRYLDIPETTTFTVSCFFLTFIVSWCSYRFIEKPLRKCKISFKRSFLILVLLPILTTCLLAFLSEKYDGFSWRFGPKFENIAENLKKHESENRVACINDSNDFNDKRCFIGDVAAKKKAFLIGDSHSNHFWNFFDVLGRDANLSINAQATPSCLPLPGIFQFDWWYFKNTVYQACNDATKKYYDFISENHFDYVILGAAWTNYDAGDHIINNINDQRSADLTKIRIEKAFRESLDIINKSGARPVIIKTISPIRLDFEKCFYRHLKTRTEYDPAICSYGPWAGDSNEWFSQLFNTLKNDYPTLIVIDPKDVQCSGTTCRTDIDGAPVYRDAGHITDYASFVFGNEYLKRYGNPLK